MATRSDRERTCGGYCATAFSGKANHLLSNVKLLRCSALTIASVFYFLARPPKYTRSVVNSVGLIALPAEIVCSVCCPLFSCGGPQSPHRHGTANQAQSESSSVSASPSPLSLGGSSKVSAATDAIVQRRSLRVQVLLLHGAVVGSEKIWLAFRRNANLSLCFCVLKTAGRSATGLSGVSSKIGTLIIRSIPARYSSGI